MWRRLGVLAVVALLAPGGARAEQQVVGGAPTDVRSAPWSVLIRIVVASGGGFFCSGSIIDPTHVLTAAHCLDLGPVGRVAPGAVSVRAGVSNGLAPSASDVVQDRAIAGYRIHPGFTWRMTGSADDVAVIEVVEPLDLSGPTATAIALAEDVQQTAGTGVRIAGFGVTRIYSVPTFTLNGMSATVGGCTNAESAVVFCAISRTSGMCPGDSGSGLVSEGATPLLVGVASIASCGPGTFGWFGNVGAPEILRFIQGDDNPPIAPREVGEPALAYPLPPHARAWMDCLPGKWSGSPVFRYEFKNERGKLLQESASPRYRLRPSDVSHRISCHFSAMNAGGVATATTLSTPAVRAIGVNGRLRHGPTDA